MLLHDTIACSFTFADFSNDTTQGCLEWYWIIFWEQFEVRNTINLRWELQAALEEMYAGSFIQHLHLSLSLYNPVSSRTSKITQRRKEFHIDLQWRERSHV